MTDFGPPIPLRKGTGGVLKIRRGGTGKVANNGTGPSRFRIPVRALRGKTGAHVSWPPRGRAIWDPTDPFLAQWRQDHPDGYIPSRRKAYEAAKARIASLANDKGVTLVDTIPAAEWAVWDASHEKALVTDEGTDGREDSAG